MENYRDGNIGTYPCGSALWQKWEIIPASGSTSKIKNMDTNKCLVPNGKELNCNDSQALWILTQSTATTTATSTTTTTTTTTEAPANCNTLYPEKLVWAGHWADQNFKKRQCCEGCETDLCKTACELFGKRKKRQSLDSIADSYVLNHNGKF